MLGGSADLAPSTNTLTSKTAATLQRVSYGDRNFHFGIREHAMAAAGNGMSLSGLRAYVATFFVFSDYLRPSMRLSSMMRLPVVYVFTHDSIGVGEDGPTHQPVEQLAAAAGHPQPDCHPPGRRQRSGRGVASRHFAARQSRALMLTRQNLPTLDRDKYAPAAGAARGGYVLADAKGGKPEVILMAPAASCRWRSRPTKSSRPTVLPHAW